jgi:MerR family copper efflux transcriptional regulator
VRIGELANRADLEVPTIRYYEAIGLLVPASRSPSGYRQYTATDLERLAFIKHNQSLGFTLREIAQLAPLHSVVTRLAVVTPSSSRELQSIVKMLEEKQKDIETKISALRKLRRELLTSIKRLRSKPAAICPAARLAKH